EAARSVQAGEPAADDDDLMRQLLLDHDGDGGAQRSIGTRSRSVWPCVANAVTPTPRSSGSQRGRGRLSSGPGMAAASATCRVRRRPGPAAPPPTPPPGRRKDTQ